MLCLVFKQTKSYAIWHHREHKSGTCKFGLQCASLTQRKTKLLQGALFSYELPLVASGL